MRKLLNKLSVLICGCLIAVCALSTFASNKDVLSTPTRDVELIEQNVDFENEFSRYEDAKLEYSKDEGYVSFSGTINYSTEELSDIDFVSMLDNGNDKLSIEYSFDYDVNENLFYLNVEAKNTEDGNILDSIVGVPFQNDNGEIDIVFDVEGDFICLSELTENKLLENCGWFSRILKKVAVAAAVVAVAAVVVVACAYAAPAVIAVATGSLMTTTIGTTVFVAGTVATSTLATCAAFAAAATTTALVASSIAATACIAIAADNILDDFNKTLSAAQAWTIAELQAALAEATNVRKNDSSKTVVYLGRDPEYMAVSLADTTNNVVTFHLDDWMFYENKHGKAGMWLLNYAFMNFVIQKEKKDYWQIRLTTDYTPYLTVRGINEEGYFYSKEINFLKNTNHTFDTYRTYDYFGSYYIVR